MPAGARQLRLVSRSSVPADLDPANPDRRRLGVCLAALSLRDDSFTLDLAPSYAGFTTGFHPAHAGQLWTDGNALLPEDLTAAMPDGFTLELKLLRTGLRYAVATQARPVAVAA